MTQVPARQLTHAVQARGGTMSDAAILVDVRLVDGAARVFGRDSSRASASEGPTGAIRMSWVRRLGRGTSIVRLDALSLSARQSANALCAINIEGAAGFGTSDILLTRVDGVAPPIQVACWSELGLTLSTSEFEKGEKIGIAWETSGLSSNDDVNRYRITIEVERVNKTGAAALAIRLRDGLGALITQSTGDAQRLSIGFTREVSARYPSRVSDAGRTGNDRRGLSTQAHDRGLDHKCCRDTGNPISRDVVTRECAIDAAMWRHGTNVDRPSNTPSRREFICLRHDIAGSLRV